MHWYHIFTTKPTRIILKPNPDLQDKKNNIHVAFALRLLTLNPN